MMVALFFCIYTALLANAMTLQAVAHWRHRRAIAQNKASWQELMQRLDDSEQPQPQTQRTGANVNVN